MSEYSFYGQTLTLINSDFFPKSLGKILTLLNHCDIKDNLTIHNITYVFKFYIFIIFTFSFSAVIQENISNDAVYLADTINSGLYTANRNCCISKIKFAN